MHSDDEKHVPETDKSEETPRVQIDLSYASILRVLGVLAGVWLLLRAWPVLLLLLFTLMMVVTLDPLVQRLSGRWGRKPAIAGLAVALCGTGALLVTIIIPPLMRQGQSLVATMPTYFKQLEALAQRARLPMQPGSLMGMFSAQLSKFSPQLLDALVAALSSVISLVSVIVLTIYLLLDGPKVQQTFISLLPRRHRLATRRLLSKLAQQVGGYVRGQLLTSALAGAYTFVLLWAFNVPEPLALAFVMAIADAVPLAGLFIGMIPALLMAMPLGGVRVLLLAAGYAVYHLIEANILVPRIFGSRLELPASVVLISLLVGVSWAGLAGALLALPVAAAVPVVIRFLLEFREREHNGEPIPLAD